MWVAKICTSAVVGAMSGRNVSLMAGEVVSLSYLLAAIDKGCCKAAAASFPIHVRGKIEILDALQSEVLGTVEISSPEEGPLLLWKSKRRGS